jgi:hypothetical protein
MSVLPAHEHLTGRGRAHRRYLPQVLLPGAGTGTSRTSCFVCPVAAGALSRFAQVDSGSLKHGSWPHASIGRRFLPLIKFLIGASVLF